MGINFLLTITGPPDAQGRQSFTVQWPGGYLDEDGKWKIGMCGQCGGGVIREAIARWENDGNTCSIIDPDGYGMPAADYDLLNKYIHKPKVQTKQLTLPI